MSRVRAGLMWIVVAAGAARAGDGSEMRAEPGPQGWHGTLEGTFVVSRAKREISRHDVRLPRMTLSFDGGTWTLGGPYVDALAGASGRTRRGGTPLRTDDAAATAAWTEDLAADVGAGEVSLASAQLRGHASGARGRKPAQVRIRARFLVEEEGAKRVRPRTARGVLTLRAGVDRPLAAASATIGASGGTLTAGSTAVTFDAGILTGAAEAELRVVAEGQAPLALAVPVSDVVRLELDPGAVAPVVAQGAGVTIPQPEADAAQPATLRAAASFDTRVALTVIQVYDVSDRSRFVQRELYSALGESVFVSAAQLACLLDALEGWRERASVCVETRIVDSAPAQSDFDPQLWRWNEAAVEPHFERVTGQLGVGTQRVVVLLHGWQSLIGMVRLQRGDTTALEPHDETWRPLLSYLGSRPDRAETFAEHEFLAIRYDSDRGVGQNADAVLSLLQTSLGTADVTVVGHSMGGLVAHVIARRAETTSASPAVRISKLVTLGTPFHGTPAVQKFFYEVGERHFGVAASIAGFLAFASPGTLDLRWDAVDGRHALTRNGLLAGLNGATVTNPMTTYRTLAGSLGPASGWRVSGYDLTAHLLLPGEESDGIVPVSSAHFRSWSAGEFQPAAGEIALDDPPYYADYDHTQLWSGHAGDASDTAVFERIAAELPGRPDDPDPPGGNLFELVHSGATDPLSEGWATYAPGAKPPVASDPLADDAGTGRGAWRMVKDTNYDRGTLYQGTLTPSQTALAASEGWRFSAWVRIPSAGTHPGYPVPPTSSMIFRPARSQDLNLTVGLSSQGVLGGWLGTPDAGSFSVSGAATAYHLYEIVWRPSTGAADLYVDGARLLTGVGYRDVGTTESNIVLWGFGSGNALGTVHFSDVRFEIGPDLPPPQR